MSHAPLVGAVLIAVGVTSVISLEPTPAADQSPAPTSEEPSIDIHKAKAVQDMGSVTCVGFGPNPKVSKFNLIAEVLAGGDVVIARRAVPAVRFVAVDAPAKRRFGALRGKIAIDTRFDESLPDEELTAWQGE